MRSLGTNHRPKGLTINDLNQWRYGNLKRTEGEWLAPFHGKASLC